MKALTDYRIREIDLLGPRWGIKRAWVIETGPYHREIAMFRSRRDAQDELTRLVNEAHEKVRGAA